VERLFNVCSVLPFQQEQIDAFLASDNYSPENLAEVMIRHIRENCLHETNDFLLEHERLPDAHEVHCGHLYMLVEMFLNHGLAPNYIFDEDTVLSAVSYVDYQYAAADITRLLLQHGGDPNLKIIDESAFDKLDFDIIFGATELPDRRLYDSWVHAWLVMIGFGGKPQNDSPVLHLKEGYSLNQFQNHERFSFSIDRKTDDPEGWVMYIIDRNTNEIAATL